MQLKKIFVPTIIGVLGGFFAGLLGLGGGAILVPLLGFYTSYSQQKIQGTVLLIMIPTVIVAGFSYLTFVKVEYSLILPLVIGSLLGVSVGSYGAHSIGSTNLQKIFGVFLLIVAIRMWI